MNRIESRILHIAVAIGAALAATAVAAAGGKPAMAEFGGMDADGNGRVTADEHAAAAKRMFEAMDADHDHKVTAAEMDAAQKQVTGRDAEPGAIPAADKISALIRSVG